MIENWIVPCSVKFYDVVSHMAQNDTIVWRKVSALREGDVVYLYLGAPYSEIKYKCHIINDNVDNELLEKNAYAIRNVESLRKQRYVLLQLDYTYPEGTFSLDKLREYGLGQTQTQARIDRRLHSYIKSVNELLGIND